MGIILVLLFFYVYQKVQSFRLGYKIRSTEKELLTISEENNLLLLKISRLVNPERIAALVKKQEWDLVPPRRAQVIRVR